MSEFSDSKVITHGDEIDLLEIVRQIWAGRKKILITMAFFVVFGGLYILYNKITIIPEYESTITLNVDSPSPERLPTIITGAPFIAEVLKIQVVNQETRQSGTVLKILNEYTQPPQGNISGMIGRITSKSGNDGTLAISVVMQNPLVAIELADSIAQKLAIFLETFQTPRAQKNQQYLSSRYRDAEAAYLQSLKTLSDFYDQNTLDMRAMDTITLKRLRAESELKLEMYSELAKQLEIARIREQEQIPIITILEPASPAKQINSPNIGKTMLIIVFLGIFIGIGLLFGKQYFDKFKTGVD